MTQRVQTRLDGDQGDLTFSSQQGSEMTSVWRFRQGEIIGVRGGPRAPRLSRVRGNCSWLVRVKSDPRYWGQVGSGATWVQKVRDQHGRGGGQME